FGVGDLRRVLGVVFAAVIGDRDGQLADRLGGFLFSQRLDRGVEMVQDGLGHDRARIVGGSDIAQAGGGGKGRGGACASIWRWPYPAGLPARGISSRDGNRA